MDKNRLNELNKAYEKACNDILKAFAEEYYVDVDKDCWVGDNVGDIVCVCDKFFLSMQDILLMLNNNVSWEEYFDFYHYNQDCAYLGLHIINLRSWLGGAIRYPKERLERLKALRKDIDELTEETIKDLEGC